MARASALGDVELPSVDFEKKIIVGMICQGDE